MALILHIGTHKTATTVVQRFADQHRDQLRAEGLEYPAWDEWLGIRGHYAHHDLAHAIADNSRWIGREQLNHFWGALREHAQERDLLISAEPMYRYLLTGYKETSSRRRAYVQRVGEMARGINVKVLLVCRRPDDFAASIYGEHVRQTRFAGSLTYFVRQKAYLFDYASQIETWGANVGTVRHLCYERLKGQGLIDAFFAQLGINVKNWSRPNVVNESKDPALIEIKRRANEAEISATDNKSLLRQLDVKRINEVLANEQLTRPRSLWPSRRSEQAFLDAALERFSRTPHWNEATYGGWRNSAADKTYMSDWIRDLKPLENVSI